MFLFKTVLRIVIVTLTVLLFLLPSLAISQNLSTIDECIWVSPLLTPDDATDIPDIPRFLAKTNELFSSNTQWEAVRSLSTGYKFYISALFQIQKNDKELFSRVVNSISDAGMKIAFEGGGFRAGDKARGKEGAIYEAEIISAVIEEGGTVDHIVLDNYFTKFFGGRSPWTPEDTYDTAVADFVAYFKEMKRLHPSVKVGLIECVWTHFFTSEFPPRIIKPVEQDLYEILEDVVDALAVEGLTLDTFHSESAYDKTIDSVRGWEKLKAIEDWCRSRGIKYGLLYNCSEGGKATGELFPGALFFSNTMKGLEAYAQAGGRPEYMTVQSWFPNPPKIIPENEPYTFMYTAKEFISLAEKLYPPPTAVNATPKEESLSALSFPAALHFTNGYIFENVPLNTVFTAFSLNGDRVVSLDESGSRQRGTIAWNFKNTAGGELLPGVYLVVFRSGEEVLKRPVIVIK